MKILCISSASQLGYLLGCSRAAQLSTREHRLIHFRSPSLRFWLLSRSLRRLEPWQHLPPLRPRLVLRVHRHRAQGTKRMRTMQQEKRVSRVLFYWSLIRSVQPCNQDCSIRTIARFEVESNPCSYYLYLANYSCIRIFRGWGECV